MKFLSKLPSLIFMLAMLAILITPALYIMENPGMLAVPTPNRAEVEVQAVFPPPDETPAPMLATAAETSMLATATPTPMLAITGSVIVTADSVNLRDGNGVASGLYVHRGDVLTVTWTPGGMGVIIYPVEFEGLTIWRGCTSDAGNLGCEAK